MITVGCGIVTHTVVEEFSEPYRKDLGSIDIEKVITLPPDTARRIVAEIVPNSWAQNPFVQNFHNSRDYSYHIDISETQNKTINTPYNQMVIITPSIKKYTKNDLFNPKSIYIFNVTMPDYTFNSKLCNADIQCQKEIAYKLEHCVYVARKSGDLRNIYIGFKALCTKTPYDRLRLMTALISLGATIPPSQMD